MATLDPFLEQTAPRIWKSTLATNSLRSHGSALFKSISKIRSSGTLKRMLKPTHQKTTWKTHVLATCGDPATVNSLYFDSCRLYLCHQIWVYRCIMPGGVTARQIGSLNHHFRSPKSTQTGIDGVQKQEERDKRRREALFLYNPKDSFAGIHWKSMFGDQAPYNEAILVEMSHQVTFGLVPRSAWQDYDTPQQ